MSRNCFARLTAIGLASIFTVNLSAQEWKEFRGPNGSGISNARGIPIAWTETDIEWKRDIPGRGWSSPVIAEKQVWITTALETKAQERVTKIDLHALCIDRESGQIVHDVPLFEVDSVPEIHLRNSYASPTPVIDGRLIICTFGTMGTAAIDRTSGTVIWKQEQVHIDHETGPGSSPIVWNDRVIINFDGIDTQSIVALDKSDGSLLWRTKRSGKLHEVGMYQKAFSTPVIWESPSGPQVVSAGANWVYGYSPDTGGELWKVDYGKTGFSNVPRPIIQGNRMYVCTGFMKSSLLAFELTANESNKINPQLKWSVDRGGPTIPSPLLVDDLIFMVSDDGIASCIDAESGKTYWYERLKGAFAASPIWIENRVWMFNDDGKVFVLEPSREFKLLESRQLDDGVMATPVALDQQLIVRTKSKLLSIRGH